MAEQNSNSLNNDIQKVIYLIDYEAFYTKINNGGYSRNDDLEILKGFKFF